MTNPTGTPPHKVLLISSVCGTVICMAMYNGIILAITPRLQSDLRIPGDLLHWPLDSFLLAVAAFTLPFGHLADILGRRLLYLVGTTICVIAALVLAFSVNSEMVIAFSTMFGFGVAMNCPAGAGILGRFPASKQKNLAYAIYGACFWTSYGLGLVIGGALTSSHGGWRSAMGLMAGLCLIFLITGLIAIPKESNEKRPAEWIAQFDWVGSALSATGLALLTFAVSDSSSAPDGWQTLYIIIMFTISMMVLAGWVLWERYLEKIGSQPIMPLSLWKQPHFSALCGVVVLTWWSYSAVVYYLNLYFQNLLHLSPLHSALNYIPTVIVAVVCNMICSWAIANISSYFIIVFSCILVAIAPLLFAFIQPHYSYWAISMPVMALVGFVDLMYPVLIMGLQTSVDPSASAMGGAVFYTVARVSSAVGLAISTSIVNAHVPNSTGRSIAGLKDNGAFHIAGWVSFAAEAVCVLVAAWFLRGIRKVGALDDKTELPVSRDEDVELGSTTSKGD